MAAQQAENRLTRHAIDGPKGNRENPWASIV
jgi:hypothetical protein